MLRLTLAAAFAAFALMMGAARAAVIENGIFYNASEPGRGYSIEQQGGQMTLIAYVYKAAGASVWFYATGAYTLNSAGYPTATLTLGEYTGGQCLGCAHTSPTGSSAGSITVSFSTAQRGQITLGTGGPFGSSSGSTISIERFPFTDATNPLLGQWSFAYSITTSSPSWTNTYGGFVRFTSVGAPLSSGGTGLVSGSPSGYLGECYASGSLAGSCLITFTSGSFTEYYVITKPLNEWRGYYSILGGSGTRYRAQGVRVATSGESTLFGVGTAASPPLAAASGEQQELILAAKRAADREAPLAQAGTIDGRIGAIQAAVAAMAEAAKTRP